jgi:hypothetical protein
MYESTSGWTSVVKLIVCVGALFWGIQWLRGIIGNEYTLLVLFAFIGVFLFMGGALFAHANQKMTLDAITKFNANDSQIDRYRQSTYKEIARGETAQVRADAQVRVLDARRVDQLAQQRAKLLTVKSKVQDDFWNVETAIENFDVIDE